MGKVEVGSIQPNLVANLVVMGRSFLLVVLHFHPLGGFVERFTSFLVNLCHRLHKLFGRWIREGIVVVRVGKDSGVSAVEYHEWAFASRTVNSIVVCEFHEW